MKPLCNQLDKSEGDINISEMRAVFQESYLSDASKKVVINDEKVFLRQALSSPCIDALKSAEGIYIETISGHKMMDFHGNNVHQVGFKNPYVVEAVIKQMEILPFCSRRYTNEPSIELANYLTTIAPGDLNKVLFAPAASLSIGMALKLARKITGKFKTISLWDAFHGASLDAISIGGEYAFKKDMGPMMTGCEHVMGMNTYRCPFGSCEGCQLKCLVYLEHVLEKQRDVGAIIIETIRNTDVQIPWKEYLQGVRKLCDKYGALLILDETAIAFGRTGKNFAFEHYDIVPDMVVVGKGLGGGIFPISALIVKEKFDVCGDISLGHYTHEKSPVGAAASLAMFRYIEEYHLLENSANLGAYLKERFETLKERCSIIGDVRGLGLLIGVELVTCRDLKVKAVDQAERIMYACMEKGVNFKVSQGNVLTLSPALIINKEEIDTAYKILEECILVEEKKLIEEIRNGKN